MSKRPTPKRSVLPDWLSGFSDDDGTDATGIPTKFLRLLMCDNAGLRRCRVVPSHRVQQVAKEGVGMTKASMAMNVWNDSITPNCGLTATGEVRLIPDLDSRVACPWHPSHEIALVDLHEEPGTPWDCCPRSALRKVLLSAKERHGINFKIGQEAEFYLLRPGILDEERGLPEPVDAFNYCQSQAFDGVATLLDDVCDCLDSFGIPIEQLHAESGPGQFEISPAPAAGLQAADNIVLVREAIASISNRHGMTATFLPAPVPGAGGSGAHTHISMQGQDGSNLIAQLLPGLEGQGGSLAESFVAGILSHLPALCIFTCPSPLSYQRIAPGAWVGAFRAWGINNRETPLRLCPGLSDSQSNVEVKSVDHTSNPYIALAAIITAGLLGIDEAYRLPPAIAGDPAHQPSLERLPSSLDAAIRSFETDQKYRTVLEATLGEPLLQAYMAVRKQEAETASTLTLQEMTRRLYQRY